MCAICSHWVINQSAQSCFFDGIYLSSVSAFVCIVNVCLYVCHHKEQKKELKRSKKITTTTTFESIQESQRLSVMYSICM